MKPKQEMGAKTSLRVSAAEESSVPAEAVQDEKGSSSVCCCGAVGGRAVCAPVLAPRYVYPLGPCSHRPVL